MKADTLYVAYSSDDQYAKFLGVSLLSLFQANADFETIRVFAIDCGIREENRLRLTRIAQENGREIVFLPMENIQERLRLKSGELGISIASYARLFLASALPEDVKRVFYLDCDTIVSDSLREAWETELGDSLVAGVQDTVDRYFLQVIGLPPDTRYVNAGILLIHLEKWRKEKIEEQFTAFIERFRGSVPHHDQGAINGVCRERRMILPLRYNLMSNAYSFSERTIRRIYFLQEYYAQDEIDEAIRRPAVIHFTSGLFGRPWEEGCTHPARDAFLRVKEQTPWKDEPLSPNTLKKGTKAFACAYRHMPRALFEGLYRMFNWVLHVKK